MKIFFMSQSFSNIFKSKYFSVIFTFALFLALLVSQLVTHINFSSEPVMSSSLPQSEFFVTLDISGNVPAEGAKVFLNGEEYAILDCLSVLVNLEKPSVIEIFCETDCEFFVAVRPSKGTCIVMPDEDLVCEKGMNYICRCFFDI